MCAAHRWQCSSTSTRPATSQGPPGRPFAKDGTFVPTPWGGDFGEYTPFGGVRVPASGKAWWDLPEGRFVYWRGCTTGLELALERAAAITARA
jgi:hypothetical protein